MRYYITLILFLPIIVEAQIRNEFEYPSKRKFPSADSIMNTFLLKYRSENHAKLYPQLFSPTLNVTPAVKHELLRLAINDWTEEEINQKVKAYLAKNPFNKWFDWAFLNKGILDSLVSLRNRKVINFDSAYHKWYDSLEVVYRMDFINKLKSSPVADEIVLSTATAQLKEMIPVLKKDLMSKTHLYSKYAATLALAAFGDSASKAEIYAIHRNSVAKFKWEVRDISMDLDAMTIILTQESISLLKDWLDTSKTYRQFTEDNDPNAPVRYFGGYVVPTILIYVRDTGFIKGYEKLPKTALGGMYRYIDPEYISGSQIVYIKEWMTGHKGHYLIY